jgi:hypothetical protein
VRNRILSKKRKEEKENEKFCEKNDAVDRSIRSLPFDQNDEKDSMTRNSLDEGLISFIPDD